MMRHSTSLAAALCIALAACTQKAQPNADSAGSSAGAAANISPAAAVDTSLVMTLERGPCRGTCPVYRVDLYADGKVRFDGKQHVGKTGMQNGTADVAQVGDLLRKFQGEEFSKVDTLFDMGSPACGSYIPDLPYSKVSAKVGTGMKTVHHDPGCRNAPPFLRTLEAQIDSVARTAQWIAGTGDAK